MKQLLKYINESKYNSSNLEDLKKQLLKLQKDDKLYCLWGVRQKATDASGKDRMVDSACSIIKVSDKKYVICSDIFFKGHELLKMACKDAGISTWWSALSGFAIRLDYEDMLKALDSMPKFFSKVIGKGTIWTYLSFDKSECEKECESQVRPFEITSLEDEIKGIEQGIKELEEKKKKLQELKKVQAEEDMWHYVNSEK